MVNYRIDLDIFAGPMDLLLYLVRKDEVDIYDIPIAKVTNQYLHYIELLQQLDIDFAGEFLVMAATLMEIKSAMLLPRAEPDEVDDADGTDPRAALVRQLLEYKKFKDAANRLHAAADKHGERYNRPDIIISQLTPEDKRRDVDMEQVSVWDLLEAFDAICRATGQIAKISNIQDDTPIDLYQIEILHRLQNEGAMSFRRILEKQHNRLAIVGQFLAILELVKGRLVRVEQEAGTTGLFIRSLTDEPAEQAVQRIIMAVDNVEELSEDEPGEALPQPHVPPIPIAEIPPSGTRANKLESLDSTLSSAPVSESTD